MANLLQVVMVETILSLHARRWSVRRIARELGIDRETVARHIRLSASDSNPAKAPLGSDESGGNSKPAKAPIGSDEGGGDSKPANAPIGSGTSDGPDLATTAVVAPGPALSRPDGDSDAEAAATVGRFSDCAPWRDAIQSMLALGLSAQRIHQDLVADHGFAGSYYSVRRFVSRLGAKLELPFRRMECGPGEEAQVDFGTGAPVLQPDGTRRRTHVFRIVLSHSRKAYSESVYRQTTESFIRCLENAFWHFGGVPQRLVLDNLRAAVTKADWFDPEMNPQVRSFAAHYGTALLPTRPYMPRHKGKVERGVDYVQENALRGRKFNTLEEQNRFLLTWEATVADTRLHGTTRQQVGKHFETVERGALQRLPAERFPCFRESRRTVHRDGHVEVERAYYSVPPEYLARQVWVRWDARLVRIFDERMKSIAVHVKHEAGRFSTQSQHIAGPKINSVERGAAFLLGKVRRIGPQSLRWAEAVIESRGVEGVRVLQGLLNLAQRHPCDALERAGDGVSRKCPLKLCVAASNEWPNPETGKELGALFDRFTLRRTVRPIATQDGERRLLWGGDLTPELSTTITPAEIEEAAYEAAGLKWSVPARDAMEAILRELRKEGVQPGDRRKLRAVQVAKAFAWLNGADMVQPDHLEILAAVLWDDPAEQPAVCQRVIAKIANPVGMRVNSALLEAEQIITGTDPRKLDEAAKAAAKLGEIDKGLAPLAGNNRAEKARRYVADKLRGLKLAAVDAI